MLKLNTTFMLQRGCRPSCCNFCIITSCSLSSVETANRKFISSALYPQISRGKTLTRRF